MATKVRVLESSNGDYNHLEIQILEEGNNSGLMGVMNVLGSITFQQNKGEKSWYGLRYVVNTDRVVELVNFTKVAKRIQKEGSFKTQPNDVLEILEAVKYYVFRHEFFREDTKGQYCFNVVENGSIYARMVAKDLNDALKKLNKFEKSNSRIRRFDLSIGESFKIE